jgi:hypothetical protein
MQILQYTIFELVYHIKAINNSTMYNPKSESIKFNLLETIVWIHGSWEW